MTFKELLQACGVGEMPRVSNGQIEGWVVAIKIDGCEVVFDHGPGHTFWYDAEPGNDYRRNYLRDLKLVESPEVEISDEQWRKHV